MYKYNVNASKPALCTCMHGIRPISGPLPTLMSKVARSWTVNISFY